MRVVFCCRASAAKGRAADGPRPASQGWRAVWFGKARDEAAEHTVVDTAAAALLALEPKKTLAEARGEAAELWRRRLSS
ncbi:hypothetical protein [Aminobacter sp. LjRoot7]|uniref:hypothetical protein n=1 Tax=Aminobacter sp. LjRoot7 TaxID=3342335 RepID=UPI003ECF3B5B